MPLINTAGILDFKINESKTEYLYMCRVKCPSNAISVGSHVFRKVKLFKYPMTNINEDMTEEIRARVQSKNRTFFVMHRRLLTAASYSEGQKTETLYNTRYQTDCAVWL